MGLLILSKFSVNKHLHILKVAYFLIINLSIKQVYFSVNYVFTSLFSRFRYWAVLVVYIQ